MREILFRGKRVENQENYYAPNGWVYGDLIQSDEETFILPNDISGEMYIEEPYKFRANDVMCSVALAKVMPETIGQFTGLTNNGKKIFEGDIVQGTIVSAWNKALIRCEVVYHKDGFISVEKTRNREWVHKVNFAKDIEVIGNIHDNPELLKEQQNER